MRAEFASPTSLPALTIAVGGRLQSRQFFLPGSVVEVTKVLAHVSGLGMNLRNGQYQHHDVV